MTNSLDLVVVIATFFCCENFKLRLNKNPTNKIQTANLNPLAGPAAGIKSDLMVIKQAQ